MIDEHLSHVAESYLCMLEKRVASRQTITSDEIYSIGKFFSRNFGEDSSEIERFRKILAFNRGVRAYFGKVGNQVLQVKAAYDHLFLVRPYRAAHVSWRFNLEGRLELIDTKILSKNDSRPLHIMRVLCNNLPKNWYSAEAILENMPDETSYSISSSFSSLLREEKFMEIVRYGHGEARYILNHLNGSLFPPNFIPDRKKEKYPMPKLKDDVAAVEILSRVSRLKPSIVIENFPYCTINY